MYVPCALFLRYKNKALKLSCMFEFSKTILQKVSFDKTLFCKELKKAIKLIQPNEKTLLKVWCLATFGNEYQKEIVEIFSNLG